MSLLAGLRDRALKRRERYQTFEVNAMPERDEIGEVHLEGVISKVALKTHRRFLRRDKLIDLDGVREAPTTIARDYLKVREFKAARLRGDSKDRLWAVMARTPAFPQYAEPGQFADAYYLDVRKAFFALMHICGWNVSYVPGKFLLRGEAPDDFPFPDHSTARNSLVTCSTSREMFCIEPPTWNMKKLSHYNDLLNTSLNALIRDVLHTIGFHAVKAGAVYVNTDGFILPDHASAVRIGSVIEDFGLAYAVKGRGRARVHAIGTYEIGNKTTKWTGIRQDAALHGVREVESMRWLAHRMDSLAAMDGHLNLRSDAL